jgi:hypothetical protein
MPVDLEVRMKRPLEMSWLGLRGAREGGRPGVRNRRMFGISMDINCDRVL